MISTILFDLDETLYPSSSGIWLMIRERIEEYMRIRLHMTPEEIPLLRRQYFETYGTTLRGLQINRNVNTEEFLAFVHDVPVEEHLSPDAALLKLITTLPQRKIIFTNADTRHARRVLTALGLESCFEKIIDIHAIAPACKPQPEAYLKALQLAGIDRPQDVAVIDDSPRNLQTARSLGCYTVLVGKDQPDPAFELTLGSLHGLPFDFAERVGMEI